MANDKQFNKVEQMLDDYYGMRPELLKQHKQRKKFKYKEKLEELSPRKKKLSAVANLFLESEERAKGTKLEQFMNKYNYYIHKLLWSTSDPFL